MESTHSRVKVAIRLRPTGVLDKAARVRHGNFPGEVRVESGVYTRGAHSARSFVFDYVLGPQQSNSDVYHHVAAPLLQAALNGYNATLLAYGQTGAGKTHTMMGCKMDRGVIPRMISQLYSELHRGSDGNNSFAAEVRISMLEIYNELVVRRPNCEESNNSGHTSCKYARISLVDLAGSERQSTETTQGDPRRCKATNDRLREGCSINGYRNSALTWLLKDSLGGNSKTVIIATVNPLEYGESLSTLRFANRARELTTQVNRKGISVSGNTSGGNSCRTDAYMSQSVVHKLDQRQAQRIINELRQEVQRLQSIIASEEPADGKCTESSEVVMQAQCTKHVQRINDPKLYTRNYESGSGSDSVCCNAAATPLGSSARGHKDRSYANQKSSERSIHANVGDTGSRAVPLHPSQNRADLLRKLCEPSFFCGTNNLLWQFGVVRHRMHDISCKPICAFVLGSLVAVAPIIWATLQPLWHDPRSAVSRPYTRKFAVPILGNDKVYAVSTSNIDRELVHTGQTHGSHFYVKAPLKMDPELWADGWIAAAAMATLCVCVSLTAAWSGWRHEAAMRRASSLIRVHDRVTPRVDKAEVSMPLESAPRCTPRGGAASRKREAAALFGEIAALSAIEKFGYDESRPTQPKKRCRLTPTPKHITG